jgi:hypothetical protein
MQTDLAPGVQICHDISVFLQYAVYLPHILITGHTFYLVVVSIPARIGTKLLIGTAMQDFPAFDTFSFHNLIDLIY